MITAEEEHQFKHLNTSQSQAETPGCKLIKTKSANILIERVFSNKYQPVTCAAELTKPSSPNVFVACWWVPRCIRKCRFHCFYLCLYNNVLSFLYGFFWVLATWMIGC